MSKLLHFLWPPDKLDPPENVVNWMRVSTVLGLAVMGFICWALGFGSAVGLGVFGGGFARADDVSKLTLSVTCSAKSGEIERTRQSIYQVKREIEAAGTGARDIDKQRLFELDGSLQDQLKRFSAVGCDKVQ